MKNNTGSLEAKMDSVLGVVQVMSLKSETVLETVLELGQNLQEQMHELRDEMRTNYATRTDLSDLEERLTTEIRAISKAVDKDAETIVDHEKRIARIEDRLPVTV